MAATAIAIGLPTLVIDIGDWTNSGPKLPPSAHHLLVLTAAMCATCAGMLYVVGILADWLDRRQEVRTSAVVDDLSGRMHALEAAVTDLTEAYAQSAVDSMLKGRLRSVN